jgi:magnesium chelatase family protein
MAAEICAAGGHSLSVSGPPGAGPGLLAGRLPTILPRLDDEEAAEVTRLHAAAGVIDPGSALLRDPPLVMPGTGTTLAEMLGSPEGRPGWAALAHRGVLFLAQAPEFRREVLDALRQPLEAGKVTVARGGGHPQATYPARFQLVVSASPCPCTAADTPPDQCQCTPIARQRYLGRLSRPLTDWIAVKTWTTVLSERDLQALTAGTGVTAAHARAGQPSGSPEPDGGSMRTFPPGRCAASPSSPARSTRSNGPSAGGSSATVAPPRWCGSRGPSPT